MTPRMPDFIGIGAPKAGTTWLFHCLREHPQIFMAEVKETNFFDYATIDGRLDEYHVHFAGAGNAAAVGEISTRYLTSAHAPQRIAHWLPDVRLFVSLRNPIEQAYSHYWHLARQNFHQWDIRRVPRSFEQALEQYPEKMLEPGRYAHHLRRWQEAIPPERLLVLFQEDFRRRPEAALFALYRHLGVHPDHRPPSLHRSGSAVRTGTTPRSERLGHVHARLYDVLNRRVYQPAKEALGPRRAILLKDVLRIRPILEATFFRPGYPPMRESTRRELREIFRPEIRAVEDLTGRRLDHWR